MDTTVGSTQPTERRKRPFQLVAFLDQLFSIIGAVVTTYAAVRDTIPRSGDVSGSSEQHKPSP